MTWEHTDNGKADPGICLFLMLIVCFCDCVDVCVWKGCLCGGVLLYEGVFVKGICVCFCVCLWEECFGVFVRACVFVCLGEYVCVGEDVCVGVFGGCFVAVCVCFLCILICFFPLLFIFGLFVSICLPNFLVWLVGLIWFFFFLKRERKRG